MKANFTAGEKRISFALFPPMIYQMSSGRIIYS